MIKYDQMMKTTVLASVKSSVSWNFYATMHITSSLGEKETIYSLNLFYQYV